MKHVAKMDVGVGDVFDLCLEEFSKRKPSSVPPPIDEEHGMCKCWSTCVDTIFSRIIIPNLV